MAEERGFPLVAILPDLWTVYRGLNAVSQHATLKLAVAHVTALVDSGAGLQAEYSMHQPEHSQAAIQLARRAIYKAKEQADAKRYPILSHIQCVHCQLWHEVDADCPPPHRPSPYGDPNA